MNDTNQTIEHDMGAPQAPADPVVAPQNEPQPIIATPRVVQAGHPLPGGTWELQADGSRVEVVR